MKNFGKIIIVALVVALIGAGEFILWQSSKGIFYDFSQLAALQSDVEIIS